MCSLLYTTTDDVILHISNDIIGDIELKTQYIAECLHGLKYQIINLTLEEIKSIVRKVLDKKEEERYQIMLETRKVHELIEKIKKTTQFSRKNNNV